MTTSETAVRTHRRSSPAILVTSFAFSVTMMGTTLPTPLPIYAHELAFTTLTVTALFAVYAIGVVATLLLLGRCPTRSAVNPCCSPQLDWQR
jgi:hypothetical protein